MLRAIEAVKNGSIGQNRPVLDYVVLCTYMFTELEPSSEPELDTDRCPMGPMGDSSGSNSVFEDSSNYPRVVFLGIDRAL